MRRRVRLRAARADGERLSVAAAANLRIPSRALPDAALLAGDMSLAEVFERVAATHGHHTALVSNHWCPSYTELNATANGLARTIIARGGEPGDRVAILMDHDAPAIAAIVAVLKASRIVVALNPTHPAARLRELIEDCDPSVVLTDAPLRTLAAQVAGPQRAILQFEEAGGRQSGDNLPIVLPPQQVAVLGYTSGSTGLPKGVMMTHRQILRNVLIHTEAMEYSSNDRIPLFGSVSGAQGMIAVWCTLLNAAALYPFPVISKGVTGLSDWMGRCGISIYISSASIFRSFVKTLDADFRFAAVRAVRLASESVTSEDFNLFQLHFRDDCWFVHTLSSTETCNIAWSRYLRRDKIPEGRLPVGMVSKGQELLILDEVGTPVARGETGEVVVRSRYLAAGYWRNPQLTRKRFSDDLDGSSRLFRTGDYGRINASGQLEFCGRRDDRVKIRGNRIALSEIEEALHRVGGIDRAVVETLPQVGREPVLAGFVTVRSGQSWSQHELRRALRALLPEHMVPSKFVFLDQLPLTSTGKLDRRALREEHPWVRTRLRPNTETETLLAGIWGDVFRLPEIDRDDNFFGLGGDSLMAAVIAARVYDRIKVELNLAMFADHPSLAQLASVVDRMRAEAADGEPPLVPLPRDAPLPLSFAQERVWKFSRAPSDAAAYVRTRTFRIVGPLDIEIMAGCMDDLARRHEMLRTTFALEGNRPVQIVHSPRPTQLRYVDLAGAEDPESQASRLFEDEVPCTADLEGGPLLRFVIVRLRHNEYQLLRTSHHIIADNISWAMYFEQLAELYRARMRGEPLPWQDKPALQYADYAVWQRKLADRKGPVFQRSLGWWKSNLFEAPREQSLLFERPSAATAVVAADGVMTWRLDRQISSKLNALAAAQSATRPMVRLAAFAALLAHEGKPDVVIGMYMTGRTRLPLQGIFGDFSNLTTLRLRFDPAKSFVGWLALVRDQVVSVESHSTIPYEELREAMAEDGVSVPEIKVIFHVSLPGRPVEFGDARLLWMGRKYERIPWGFTLDYEEENDRHDGHVLFDARIYDPSGVRRFVERYQRLLIGASRHADKTLDALLATSCQAD
jgi:amino acid adenylation domain-containing protein